MALGSPLSSTTSRHITIPGPQARHNTAAFGSPNRSFSSTASVSKKKGKDKKDAHGSKSDHAQSTSTSHDDEAKHPSANANEPMNLDDVTSRLKSLDMHYRESLKIFQAGSRFNPAVIGALPVQVSKSSRETFPLRELAEIVPRGGRSISLLVHDKEYVKPIISAVQSSDDFNQQPQRDPDNELELTLKIEPERREEQAARLKAVTLQWRDRIRQVRSKREKQTDKWVKEKVVLLDVGAQVAKALGKLQDETLKDIDKLEKQILKGLEQTRS
jgi:ribosome recycling factor